MTIQDDRYLQGGMEVFLDAIASGDPSGAIEAQEARGQQALVRSELLPVDGPWDVLAELGVTHEPSNDPLFYKARLPQGWGKQATEHNLWSRLHDDKGRVRGSIFYKAAFYDRKASFHLEKRYAVTTFYGAPPQRDDFNSELRWFGVLDQADNKVLFATATAGQDEVDLWDRLLRTARAWRDERYPEWENPLAYWDDEPTS